MVLTLVLGETKAYYSEDESAKRERGTRDGLLFTLLIPDRDNTDRSSLQGEYLAGMGKNVTSERNSRPQSCKTFICRTTRARFVCYCEFL
jgi:hypothetical protein